MTTREVAPLSIILLEIVKCTLAIRVIVIVGVSVVKIVVIPAIVIVFVNTICGVIIVPVFIVIAVVINRSCGPNCAVIIRCEYSRNLPINQASNFATSIYKYYDNGGNDDNFSAKAGINGKYSQRMPQLRFITTAMTINSQMVFTNTMTMAGMTTILTTETPTMTITRMASVHFTISRRIIDSGATSRVVITTA